MPSSTGGCSSSGSSSEPGWSGSWSPIRAGATQDIDADERPREALWLSAVLAEEGYDVSPEAAERLLELHRVYLEAPPPDPDETAAPDGQVPRRQDRVRVERRAPSASTSETPNVAPPSSPATAGDGPTQ